MRFFIPSIFCAALLLGACTDSSHLAGIEGTGDTVTATGTVTAFGSIYVNGIHFETDNATVEINGLAGQEADLQTGMVVYVEGTLNQDGKTGEAGLIRYDQILKGTVDEVEPLDFTRKSLTILGQTVIVADDTDFKSVTFNSISTGDEIAISGFNNTDTSIAATHVASAATEDPVEVEGAITAVDATALTFDINGQTVSYASATISGGSDAELEIGTRVEAIGTLAAEPMADSTLDAETVRIIPEPASRSGPATLEGVISDFESQTRFSINGVPVNAGTAEFELGQSSNLANGKRVVINGQFDSAGKLQAETLRFASENNSRFSGAVEAVDPVNEQITVMGTLFQTTPYTAFEDKRPSPERYFHIDRISVGDQLEIFATFENDQWVATRIRRVPPIQFTELRGIVERFTSDVEFYVSGILIHADSIENPEVLDQLNKGDFVTVDGEFSGGMHFEASQITIHEAPKCDRRFDPGCDDKFVKKYFMPPDYY